MLLVGIALARERSLRVGGADLRRLLVIGGVIVFGNQLTFAFSFRFTSAAVIALLFGTMPVIALLFSAALGLERIRMLQWVAAAVSFAGVGLVAGGAHGGTHSSVTGILLGLASPATFVIYSIALAPLVRRHGTFRVNALSAVITVAPLIAVSIPALTTLALGPRDRARVAVPALQRHRLRAAEPAVVRRRRPRRHGAGDALGQRAAVRRDRFAVLLLSERITALTFVGGGVLAAGIALSRLRGRRRRRPPSASSR